MDDTTNLTQLGSNKTDYMYDQPLVEILESFENKNPQRDYMVQMEFEEFTSLCPKTGQPDFASITIEYIPDKLCVESKSLKLYLFAYRQHGAFMESIVNKILSDLVSAINPRWMSVTGSFKARGGIVINVLAEFEAPSHSG